MKKFKLFFSAIAITVLIAAPAWALDALQWGDQFAEAFRSSFRGSNNLTASVDPKDNGLNSGRAQKVFLFISGAVVNGLRYERLTVELRDVSFTVSGGGLLITSIGSSAASGNIAAEDLAESILPKYPRLTKSTLNLIGDRVNISGVYIRQSTFPLRATMHFWGHYVVHNGVASLQIDDSRNDNALVSARDVGRAICDAAPQISFQGQIVTPKITSVKISKEMVWVKAGSVEGAPVEPRTEHDNTPASLPQPPQPRPSVNVSAPSPVPQTATPKPAIPQQPTHPLSNDMSQSL